MKSLALVCLAAIMTPAVALAQVVQSYTYDGNGRLTGVATSTPTGTATGTYAYDAANNRTSRTQTGTGAYAALFTRPFGQPFQADEALFGLESRYTVALLGSGRVELQAGDVEGGANSETLVRLLVLDNAGSGSLRRQLNPVVPYLSLSALGDMILFDRGDVQAPWDANGTRNAGAAQ